MVRPGQTHKLKDLAFRMAVARATSLSSKLDPSQWSDKQRATFRTVSWVLFLAKCLVPPLSLLNELEIEWRAEFVQAGRGQPRAQGLA